MPHLASHLLGFITKTISQDWLHIYHHPLFWLETFVDTERFAGTCYEAVNWIFLGLTFGRGTKSRSKKQLTTIKALYGYPLAHEFRDRLCNE